MGKIYTKYTNGCTPNSIKYNDDKIEIIFNFMGKPYKKFIIYANINEGDGDAYLDFSVIDLYKERLLKAGCNSFDISLVDGMGILLIFEDTKVFIPAYHHYIYYTSDFNLVIEYTEIKENKTDKTIIDLGYIE